MDCPGRFIETGLARAGERRISLVVPVFNEEKAIAPFLEALDRALLPVRDRYDFEVIFINDGSQDRTEPELRRLAMERSDLTVIHLSRNFGKEAALSAGIDRAEGDAVIPIDVDLQDPPELIPEMLALWQGGAKIVNARRGLRASDTWAKRTSANAFYRIFNVLADHPMPSNVGDFRLMDREVVRAIRDIGERSRFNKALFSWVGFPTEEVIYERPARETGDSAWSYWKLWKLALDGIFSSSTMPLRIWTYVGVILTVVSFSYALIILLRTLFWGVDTPGYASTVILILAFGGLNMFALGIIGEYVGRIYTEVRQRPRYIVRSVEAGRREDGDGA